MIRETISVGLLRCNCSVLGDEVTREAIVVDPGYEIPRILQLLAKHHLTVKTILVTHAHIDHIASALRLKEITGAPIVYNHLDLPLVAMMSQQAGWLGVPEPDVAPPDHSPGDGEAIQAGAIRGNVMYTPGHTEGSICLYVPKDRVLLAGDTLFAGGVGRTDLPGGDSAKLMASIEDRLMMLPNETIVVPGHGPETTIGQERRSNPFLQ
jgi:glyoxylase-like metal-dependent hydrolase (beta-lactamase superfamily II)